MVVVFSHHRKLHSDVSVSDSLFPELFPHKK